MNTKTQTPQRPKVAALNYKWLRIEGAKRGLTPGRFLNSLLSKKELRRAILSEYDGEGTKE